MSAAGAWGDDEAALGAALKAFVKQHKLGGEEVYSVLPRHAMTARLLNLPSHDPAEIKQMIRLTAEEYVPFALRDLVTDVCQLEKLGDGHSLALAVFAQREYVEQHIELLRGAGVEPQSVYMRTACLASVAAAAGVDGERWGLVHLAKDGLEVLVFHYRALVFSRGVGTSRDWSVLAEDGEASEELCLETRATLSSYKRESEDGLGVEDLYVAADGLAPDAAIETLSPEVTAVCQPFTLPDKLIARGKEHVDGVPLSSLGAALTAQGRARAVIDLTPDSLLQTRGHQALPRQVLVAAGLVLAALLSLGGAFAHKYYQNEAYIQELESRARSMAPKAESLMEKQRQLLVLQRAVNQSGGVLECLRLIIDAAPQDMNISEFAYRPEGILVKGRAETGSIVDQFSENIREIGRTTQPLLELARITGRKNEQEKGQAVVGYEITIPFPLEGEEGAAAGGELEAR